MELKQSVDTRLTSKGLMTACDTCDMSDPPLVIRNDKDYDCKVRDSFNHSWRAQPSEAIWVRIVLISCQFKGNIAYVISDIDTMGHYAKN